MDRELRMCTGRIVKIGTGGAGVNRHEIVLELADIRPIDDKPPFSATSFLSTSERYERDVVYEATPNFETLVALSMFAANNGFRVQINAFHTDRSMASIHAFTVEIP